MTDHLAPAREVNRQDKHPAPEGRAIVHGPAMVEQWPRQAGESDSGQPDEPPWVRLDLESKNPK